MDTRRLGHSDLAITPIGLGAWAIGGGDWCLGWGPQRDDHSIATIRRALDRGINWIDTSSVYGLGRSEMVIARALRAIPRRNRPYVFTKCGLVWDELGNVSANFGSQSIRAQAEASLRRLGVEAIDLYQIDLPCERHGRFNVRPGSVDEAWDTMAALQREGKVRWIGVANARVAQLPGLHQAAPITSVQAGYSLLRREIEDELLPYCARHDIGVLAASPMEAGLLTGAVTPERLRMLPHNDWRRCNPSFSPDEVARALHIVDELRAIGARHGVVAGAVAIAWTLRTPAITAAIAGARRPEQVDELVPAASLRGAWNAADDAHRAGAAPGDPLPVSYRPAANFSGN